MTAGVALGAPRLRLVLPGEWWAAPVALGPQERADEIAALVRRQVGPRDDLARLRAEHRARLGEALDLAIGRGAVQQHVSIANEGGAAFASTVTEYALPRAFGSSPEPAVLADRVVGALHGAVADSWAAFEASGGVAFAKGESIVVRAITRREGDASDASSTDVLVVDYWLTVPDEPAIVLLTFSTVLAPLEELMLELYDRIVAAAEWQERPAPRSLRDDLLGARPES